MMRNKKTYAQTINQSTLKNTEELPKSNMKTYAQIASATDQVQKCRKAKKTSETQYAQTASYSSQIANENTIFIKAIEIAKKHKIKLKAGRKDRGYGNCVFEAAINNINDRDCFSNKLLQTPNWYRQLWMDNMMERIILRICPWNLGYTEHQLREGFDKLKMTGVYEIDFFGDMMLGGIACGIRKRILIFNTSDNLLHDPISVVDPQHYDIRIKVDNETPIVVAYNNYHYENLHPVDDEDRQETLRLVNSYTNGRYNLEYGFKKKDIQSLLSPSLKNFSQKRKPSEQESSKSSIRNMRQMQSKQEKQIEKCIQEPYCNNKHCYNPEKSESEDLRASEMHNKQWIKVISKRTQKRKIDNPQQMIDKTTYKPKIKKIADEKFSGDKPEICIKSQADKNKKSDLNLKDNSLMEEKECFKWGNIKFEEMENAKIKFGFCQTEC